ncbi:hypothetical protein XspCFBP7912_05420 [Xanthomonas sp. CFBP 7912]|nr:hypothetical protein XspCFBP7912_05420 [Xanthomonas sp. CFBP 7912]RJS05630.1 hypothetical protein XnspCFBP7698_05430 [Xanthomonas sp. CFBP 7698]
MLIARDTGAGVAQGLGGCTALHLFHTPCGWNLHKAVDNCVQAPACNAVKMGGEKMTSRSQETIGRGFRSDPGRIGKVLRGAHPGSQRCAAPARHGGSASRTRCFTSGPAAHCHHLHTRGQGHTPPAAALW